MICSYTMLRKGSWINTTGYMTSKHARQCPHLCGTDQTLGRAPQKVVSGTICQGQFPNICYHLLLKACEQKKNHIGFPSNRQHFPLPKSRDHPCRIVASRSFGPKESVLPNSGCPLGLKPNETWTCSICLTGCGRGAAAERG